MFGLNVADHEFWTVEGVGQGVFVGRLVQKFNNSWEGGETEREIQSVKSIADLTDSLWFLKCVKHETFLYLPLKEIFCLTEKTGHRH